MNQNPEQIARDEIDKQLIACGWHIQDKSKINLNAGIGVAVREYPTDVGPADYVIILSIVIKEKRHGMKRILKEDGENILMMKLSIVIKLLLT